MPTLVVARLEPIGLDAAASPGTPTELAELVGFETALGVTVTLVETKRPDAAAHPINGPIAVSGGDLIQAMEAPVLQVWRPPPPAVELPAGRAAARESSD